MLLYSLLYLTGYDLPLEHIKQFRQWGSMTPGHPERGVLPGVETTTGPLDQGFGNGVGIAIAEAYLAARYNRPGFEISNHFTYGIVSDGDLMEGVAAEAASLAGHLQLGKLIYLYDNNHISLASSTRLTFTEDCARRFAAYGWHTQSIEDGNDLEAGPQPAELRRPPGAARAHPGAVGEAFEPPPDQAVPRVGPLRDRGDGEPGCRLGGKVLQGVDGDVDGAVEERLLDLLDEDAGSQRNGAILIARCRDEHFEPAPVG